MAAAAASTSRAGSPHLKRGLRSLTGLSTAEVSWIMVSSSRDDLLCKLSASPDGRRKS
jgi:hypothetical protein